MQSLAGTLRAQADTAIANARKGAELAARVLGVDRLGQAAAGPRPRGRVVAVGVVVEHHAPLAGGLTGHRRATSSTRHRPAAGCRLLATTLWSTRRRTTAGSSPASVSTCRATGRGPAPRLTSPAASRRTCRRSRRRPSGRAPPGARAAARLGHHLLGRPSGPSHRRRPDAHPRRGRGTAGRLGDLGRRATEALVSRRSRLTPDSPPMACSRSERASCSRASSWPNTWCSPPGPRPGSCAVNRPLVSVTRRTVAISCSRVSTACTYPLSGSSAGDFSGSTASAARQAPDVVGTAAAPTRSTQAAPPTVAPAAPPAPATAAATAAYSGCVQDRARWRRRPARRAQGTAGRSSPPRAR